MNKIDNKQNRFVQEYLIDLNATKAAIRAGYSKKTAEQIGYQLLQKTSVQGKIQKAMEARGARTQVTQDMIITELAIIGFSDLKNYLDVNDDTGAIKAKGFDQMPKNSSRALESIQEDRAIKENADGDSVTVYDKVKFKLHDKVKSLELLGKHFGMFIDKHEFPGLEKVLYEISDKFMPKIGNEKT